MNKYFGDKNPIKMPATITTTVVIRAAFSYITPDPIFAMQMLTGVLTFVTVVFAVILGFVRILEWIQSLDFEYLGTVCIMITFVLSLILLQALKYKDFVKLFKHTEGG
jgi:hypothetical protein